MIKFLKVEIKPFLHRGDNVGITFEITDNYREYGFNQVIRHDDFKTFYDQIFDQAKEEIRHAYFNEGKIRRTT